MKLVDFCTRVPNKKNCCLYCYTPNIRMGSPLGFKKILLDVIIYGSVEVALQSQSGSAKSLAQWGHWKSIVAVIVKSIVAVIVGIILMMLLRVFHQFCCLLSSKQVEPS